MENRVHPARPEFLGTLADPESQERKGLPDPRGRRARGEFLDSPEFRDFPEKEDCRAYL